MRPRFPGVFGVILFLDFDGVLHPDPCPQAHRLFEQAPRLARLLEPFPDVGVVLSTSWRTVRPEHELLDPLPAALRQRILGMNPRCNDFAPAPALLPYRRHAECAHWLRQHGMADSAWLAVDDRPDWFAPYCENLVECDSRIGLDERVCQELASRLAQARRRAGHEIDLVLA